jgi:hypothetical protein
MILPFVREIFAELEHSSGFERVQRHLSLGAGRRRVSGLTATARALYLPLMARAARQPVIVVVADNKAAEALEQMLKAGCDRRGGPCASGAISGPRCASFRESFPTSGCAGAAGGGLVEAGHWGGLHFDCAGGVGGAEAL